MKNSLLLLVICVISSTSISARSPSHIPSFKQFSRLPFTENAIVQTSSLYKGKVVRSKGTCNWLIRITRANDESLLGKLIAPTGDFPEIYQKRGTLLRFEMTPLRQPVPDGCKADIIASIVNLTTD